MAIEKCINEFDVDQVIFEEGSTGRELSSCSAVRLRSPSSTTGARP
jgi:hypothetical protein